MGITRYAVRCPGCEQGILLRLGVGVEREQPFFYVCPTCQAATKGCLEYLGGARTRLTLEAGELLDDTHKCGATLSINPDFPAIASAATMGDPGGSAFIMHAQILGNDRLLVFEKNLTQLRGTVETSWSDLRRLTTYYLNKDWKHFDVTARKVAPAELLNDQSPWARDHAIHFLYDILLAPSWTADRERTYPELKKIWYEALGKLGPHFQELISFAKASTATVEFHRLQKDLFERVAEYVALIPALIPGMVMNMYPKDQESRIPELRLFRDEFSQLRDLYVQTFESCHRVLRYVLGALNAQVRGNADAFPSVWPVPQPNGQKAPKVPTSLASFDELVNARKADWLAVLPHWGIGWSHLLDRPLRNEIGHASIRHDLPSGMLISDDHTPIAYTVFVQRAQRLVGATLLCLSVLKLLRVYSYHS